MIGGVNRFTAIQDRRKRDETNGMEGNQPAGKRRTANPRKTTGRVNGIEVTLRKPYERVIGANAR